MYGFGFKFPPYRPLEGGFSVLDLNPKFWALPTDETTVNALLSADFVSANSESLSSASTDFDKGNEDFSFGGWLKFDNSGLCRVMGKWNTTGNNRSYGVEKGGSNVLVFYLSGNGSTVTSVVDSTTISTATWTFFTCVYDSVNDLMKISVNGNTFVTNANTTGAFASSTADFIIGEFSTIYGDFSSDAMFFYDKALSQSEVNALYNSGSGVMYADLTTAQKTSLVSWWQLNEPSGNRGDSHGTNTLTDNNSVLSVQGHIQEEVTQDGDSVYTVIDKSGTNNNALQSTVADQPTWLNAKELDFDGSTDFLNLDAIINDVSTDTTGTFSVWVKPTSGTPVSNGFILNFGDTSGADNRINLYQNTLGKIGFITVLNGVVKTNLLTDNAELSTATWSHICCVQNGVDLTIYVDSVEVAQTESGTNPETWFNDIPLIDNGRLACYNNNGSGDSFHFDGQIGEVVITSEALNSGQVSDLYNSQKSVYA